MTVLVAISATKPDEQFNKTPVKQPQHNCPIFIICFTQRYGARMAKSESL